MVQQELDSSWHCTEERSHSLRTLERVRNENRELSGNYLELEFVVGRDCKEQLGRCCRQQLEYMHLMTPRKRSTFVF